MLGKISVLLAVLYMAGCTTVPDSLQVAEEVQLVDYPEVVSSPQQSIDKLARWGGVIAEIENQSDVTMLELVFYPLRSYGKPLVSDESIGRFRVYVDGFLDPMVFAKGRLATFTGQVLGVEDGLVGEQKYVFPTLHSQGYHLWKDVQKVDVSAVYVWPYWYGWHSSPFYPRMYIRGSGHHYNDGIRGGSSTGSSPAPSRPAVPATRSSNKVDASHNTR
jgi:outer membrane lipoprotein